MYTIKEGYRGRFVAALLNETAEFRKKGMRHSTMERLVQKTEQDSKKAFDICADWDLDRKLGTVFATELDLPVTSSSAIVLAAREKAGKEETTIKYDATDRICEIYRAVTSAVGFSDIEAGPIGWDCRKIWVSADIQNDFFAALHEDGKDAVYAASVWMIAGPKTDKTLPERTVRLEYGFFRNRKGGDEE